MFGKNAYCYHMKRLEKASLPTKHGDFDMLAYESPFNDFPHVVLFSKTKKEETPIVRVHSECMTGDVFGSARCDCGEQLDYSLDYVNKHGGIVIYLRQEGRGIGLVNKMKAYNLQDTGLNTYQANISLGFHQDERKFNIAKLILDDLGIQKIKLLTNNPDKIKQLEEAGIVITERIPIEIKAHSLNKDYLQTKKNDMGHMLDQF
jgi:3,4-dihydroxy 2-butanone 4-phosphate synthase/GTP cyclohydrolase II